MWRRLRLEIERLRIEVLEICVFFCKLRSVLFFFSFLSFFFSRWSFGRPGQRSEGPGLAVTLPPPPFFEAFASMF